MLKSTSGYSTLGGCVVIHFNGRNAPMTTTFLRRRRLPSAALGRRLLSSAIGDDNSSFASPFLLLLARKRTTTTITTTPVFASFARSSATTKKAMMTRGYSRAAVEAVCFSRGEMVQKRNFALQRGDDERDDDDALGGVEHFHAS